jgi:hypothetical protein
MREDRGGAGGKVIDHRLGVALAKDIHDDAALMEIHMREAAAEAVTSAALLQRWLSVAKYLKYEGAVVADTKKALGVE